MVKILLVDVNTVYHVGNAALLESSIEQLKTTFSGAKFTILAFDPDSIAKMCPDSKVIECLWARPFSSFSLLGKISWMIREGTWAVFNALNLFFRKTMGIGLNPSLYTFSPIKREVMNAYSDADIVISISGEMLSDHNWKRLPLFLYGYWLAYIMEKIVVIFPQSIGPLDKKPVRAMVRYVLNRCDLVVTRDRISLGIVSGLGIPESKVSLVPDVALNQPYISSDKARELLEKEGVNLDWRPLIGITISKFRESDYRKYFQVIKQLCQFLAAEIKGEVVFFSPNMPYRQERSDLSLAQDLYNELPDKENVVVISNLYTPAEFKGMLGELDMFISTRMHISILATMRGTPTITINSQPKLKGYMKMINQGEWSCDVKDFTMEKAKELVISMLENNGQIRASLAKSREEVAPSSLEASKLLKDLYERR
jgi:polysaccharide pyruvyl transferase WcaK-like protein